MKCVVAWMSDWHFEGVDVRGEWYYVVSSLISRSLKQSARTHAASLDPPQ